MSGNSAPTDVGISALKNSDVLTAVSIIAGDVARFPLIEKNFAGEVEDDAEINYLLNVKSTKSATGSIYNNSIPVLI